MNHGTHVNRSLLACECVCTRECIGLFWRGNPRVVAVLAERALQYRGLRGIADGDRAHVTVVCEHLVLSVGLSVMYKIGLTWQSHI